MAALMVAAVVIASLVDNNNRRKGLFCAAYVYVHVEEIFF